MLDVMGVQGNGTSYTVQEEAGVEDADLMIAVTDKDEINLLACLIAKKAGNCQTIARVRNPEYHKEIGFIKEELGLSMVVNPELAAAAEIGRLIQVPSAMEIDTFAKGKVNLVKFEVPMNSAWAGMKIMWPEISTSSTVLTPTRTFRSTLPPWMPLPEKGAKPLPFPLAGTRGCSP